MEQKQDPDQWTKCTSYSIFKPTYIICRLLGKVEMIMTQISHEKRDTMMEESEAMEEELVYE